MASIGNFSVGFDVLGVALEVLDGEPLGDVVRVSAADGERHQLEVTGPFSRFLPTRAEDNLVWKCLRQFDGRLAVPALKIHLDKQLPVGSGLGSSASSIVAAAAGINEYARTPLSQTQLLNLCGQLEGGISGAVHLDNVAPALLGGIVLCNGEHSRQLPFNPDWRLVVAYSGQTLSTRKMRQLLPPQYPLTTVVKQMTGLAAFVDALHRADWSLAADCLRDHLAEPWRAEAIEGFTIARQACQRLGAAAVGISGSGPTLFALCEAGSAKAIRDWLDVNYHHTDAAFSRICRIRAEGVALSVGEDADPGMNEPETSR